MDVAGKPTHSANFTLLILALAIGGCLLAIIIVVSGAVTFYLQNRKEDIGLKEQAETRNGIHSTIPAGIREYIEVGFQPLVALFRPRYKYHMWC